MRIYLALRCISIIRFFSSSLFCCYVEAWVRLFTQKDAERFRFLARFSLCVCAPDILFIHIFHMNAQNCDHLAFIAKSGGCNRHSEDVAYSLCAFFLFIRLLILNMLSFRSILWYFKWKCLLLLNLLYLQLDCNVVLLLLCLFLARFLRLLLLLYCYPSHHSVYWIVILERIWFTWCINFVSKMEKHSLCLCTREREERDFHQSGWIHETPKIVHGLSSKHYSF